MSPCTCHPQTHAGARSNPGLPAPNPCAYCGTTPPLYYSLITAFRCLPRSPGGKRFHLSAACGRCGPRASAASVRPATDGSVGIRQLANTTHFMVLRETHMLSVQLQSNVRRRRRSAVHKICCGVFRALLISRSIKCSYKPLIRWASVALAHCACPWFFANQWINLCLTARFQGRAMCVEAVPLDLSPTRIIPSNV